MPDAIKSISTLIVGGLLIIALLVIAFGCQVYMNLQLKHQLKLADEAISRMAHCQTDLSPRP